jgi:hypothetical protein
MPVFTICGSTLGAVAWQSFIVILGFAALHREPRIGAVVVAGHVIVLKPEQIEERRKRTSFELLTPSPAARNFCALTKSEGFLIPGGTSARM